MRGFNASTALLVAVATMAAAGGGCSHQITGGPESGVDMGRYQSFYVVSEKADSDVAAALVKDLSTRGLSVTRGPDSSASSSPSDCKVVFHDKWMWDMTMYLLELKLEMVDARSGALLASGRCYRTSVVRKSPEVMVKEITDLIFGTKAEAADTKTASAAVQ